MKPPHLTLEQVKMLPTMTRVVIPAEYRDSNDHMNVRYYMTIFDEAGYPMYDILGLTPEFLKPRNGGGFDLEHHLHYLNEVRVGDTVAAVHVRMVKRTAKRMHYIMFMANETRGEVAATFECVNSYADLSARKTAPWPPEVAAVLDMMVEHGDALPWPSPVCGVMSA